MVLESKEVINGLQIKVYKLSAFAIDSARSAQVKRGSGHGRVIFESKDVEDAKTFVLDYDDLIERKFEIMDGSEPREVRAWFDKDYPTELFKCSTYEPLTGQLVRFKEPFEDEPQGFIKIY